MLQSSTELTKILNTRDHQRDAAWEKRFLSQFTNSHLQVLNTEPTSGPDGFSYLLADILPAETGEPALRVVEWLSTRGIGLVINPNRKSYPDYVFPYGMLWNFRERGEFLTAAEKRSDGELHITPGQQLWVGQPSDSYLPGYVRSLIRQFLLDQRVIRPQILMISSDQKNYDLAVSTESLGQPPAEEHAGIAQAISWFLPAHYSVVLISNKLVSGFADL